MTTSHSMLVPGSIWERAKKRGEPTQSRVLCVSNEDLQPPASESNPPQVIFVSDKLKVLTMPIERFIANRTYVGIDEHMKALAEALVTSPDVLDDDEEIDFDAVPLPDPLPEEEPAISVVTAGGAKKRMQIADLLFGDEEPAALKDVPTTTPDLGVTLTPNPAVPPVAREVVFGLTIDGAPQYAELLQQSFVGYSESPFYTGDTQHALKFQLSVKLDLSMLHNAFGPTENSVSSFTVVNSYETTEVTIDSYVDTFLSVEKGIGYGVVYVTSLGDFRNKEYEDSQIPEGDGENDEAPAPHVATTVIDIPAAPTVPDQAPPGMTLVTNPETVRIVANLAQQGNAQVNVTVG